MPYVRTPELIGFQRWIIGAYDKGVPWAEWQRARYQPRNLGDRTSAQLYLIETGRAGPPAPRDPGGDHAA